MSSLNVFLCSLETLLNVSYIFPCVSQQCLQHVRLSLSLPLSLSLSPSLSVCVFLW